MPQAPTWLLLLATLSSCVSAFYPYQQHTDSKNSEGGNEKRFIPIQQRPGQPDDGLLRADLLRVPRVKRDNRFAITASNPPTFGPNALAIDQDGSDYSYLSTIKFGSKAQPMHMLVDTGSSNTWVFGTDCQSSTCQIHNLFGKENSTSLKTTTNPWNLSYGTGAVSGMVASDTVAFANFSINLSFGIATNASDDFNNYPMDGILGLGRRTSDVLGSTTLMDILSQNKLIAATRIGVHLHRAADNTKDGEIVFGGIDTGKFSGALTYTKTANNDAWEIPVEDTLVNGTPANFTGKTAILDTGTTFILMPPADAKTLHGMIPGSVPAGEGYNVPCNTNAKLEIRINGKLYNISPKDYVGKPVSSGSPTCTSTIIGHQAFGPSQWILGDVFLKNVYTVFDFDNKQVGFGMPGTGGVVSSPTSSSTSVSPASSGTSSPSKTGSATGSSSGKASSTASSDSNIGGESGKNGAAGTNAAAYWKVTFSIFAAFWLGVGAVITGGL